MFFSKLSLTFKKKT